MPKRDELHDRQARTKFNDQAQRAMQTSQKAAVGARKTAEDAALDLTARKEFRRKRVAGTKRRTP